MSTGESSSAAGEASAGVAASTAGASPHKRSSLRRREGWIGFGVESRESAVPRLKTLKNACGEKVRLFGCAGVCSPGFSAWGLQIDSGVLLVLACIAGPVLAAAYFRARWCPQHSFSYFCRRGGARIEHVRPKPQRWNAARPPRHCRRREGGKRGAYWRCWNFLDRPRHQ